MFTVVEYIREDGSNPYKTWFDSLHAQAAEKVATATTRLEMGNTSSVKWMGALGEYRIDLGTRLPDLPDAGWRFDHPSQRRNQEGPEKRYRTSAGARGRIQGAKSRCEAKTQEVNTMALTRDFKQTVVERVRRDPAFAKALLDEAATLFLNGEPNTARLILRDLVNATMGFEALAAKTGKPTKSLHRMLSKRGNPSMDNLATILSAVRKKLRVSLRAHTVDAA